jgi:hypothetical protein
VLAVHSLHLFQIPGCFYSPFFKPRTCSSLYTHTRRPVPHNTRPLSLRLITRPLQLKLTHRTTAPVSSETPSQIAPAAIYNYTATAGGVAVVTNTTGPGGQPAIQINTTKVVPEVYNVAVYAPTVASIAKQDVIWVGHTLCFGASLQSPTVASIAKQDVIWVGHTLCFGASLQSPPWQASLNRT